MLMGFSTPLRDVEMLWIQVVTAKRYDYGIIRG